MLPGAAWAELSVCSLCCRPAFHSSLQRPVLQWRPGAAKEPPEEETAGLVGRSRDHVLSGGKMMLGPALRAPVPNVSLPSHNVCASVFKSSQATRLALEGASCCRQPEGGQGGSTAACCLSRPGRASQHAWVWWTKDPGVRAAASRPPDRALPARMC